MTRVKPTSRKSSSNAEPAYLLDVNVLIALAWPQHVHHKAAHVWFDQAGCKRWASCPLTQLAFVRISSNAKIITNAVSPRAAMQALAQMTALSGHQFWPDDLPLGGLASFSRASLVGHRQVTDAYLLEIARHRQGILATLDGGIADLLAKNEPRTRIELIRY
ncbi:MAG: TA system VapC family ribonuclease toxin [Betaproteobacteria bacterium]